LIPKECKRLAEVDFPVAEVSRHSAREKSIRHGHPSTLHLWWARRPLAACRAMLMALLLPDPCDVNCPAEFREEARQLLKPMPNCGATGSNKELRDALLKFIADFANWDNSAKTAYLDCARGLVKAAHGEEPLLAVDPFAGGGSIPLEALRIGCDAFASDLNPVACLILKVLLEDIPRHGLKLAEELRRVGKQIKEEAEKELAEFYPPDPDGARPIAYLWARTVRCESTLREAKDETEESVSCDAEIPLMRSFWLCKKANRRRALRLVHERHPKNAKDPLNTLMNPERWLRFEIFEPESEGDVRGASVSRARAVCPVCGKPLAPDRVRAQLSAQRGGADAIFDANGRRIGGARLLAVVTLDENKSGRQYRSPTERDYETVWKAQTRLKKVSDEWERDGRKGLCPAPDEPTPAGGGSGAGRAFSVQRYGMLQWGDLFTARQKLALGTLTRMVGSANAIPDVKDLLGLTIDRVCSRSSALCLWRYHADQEKVEHIFGRQALPVVWDFAEAAVCSESTGSFTDGLEVVSLGVETATRSFKLPGQVQQADACNSPLLEDTANVWFTDPPYYDAIPYADLSDFFFVWLRRSLPEHVLLRNPFEADNPLSPKCPEIVQDEVKRTPDGHPKDRNFFEEAVGRAFAEGRRVLREDGIGAVVFAHKTTEGWEALISGMLLGGWTVTGSWPITTEMANRLRARESAALAASVHLVCRPRPENAGIGGWEDILRELPNRIGEWMERLSGEGIRGADLVFSCIGPALELFSRYEKVETAEGREVKLDEFLAKVWEVVGRTALQQILGTAEARARNSTAGALEEDARLTALFLWTLQSTNGTVESRKSKVESEVEEEEVEEEEESGGKPKRGYVLIYDVARRFAQPLGIHLENWEGRIIETKKGVVRLIPVQERAEQLFGQAGTEAAARAIERSRGESAQIALFPNEERVTDTPIKTRKAGRRFPANHPLVPSSTEEGSAERGVVRPAATRREATTLDRVHAAMLLQAGGQATALRAMLEAETQRSPDFLRLANALSALYPKDSEEKRLLDAMLLGVRS
jgi:adenine-specific DNA methylase